MATASSVPARARDRDRDDERSGPRRAARYSNGSRGGGRPSKLTDEVERKLCRHLRAGLSLEQAAVMESLAPSTVYGWVAEGRRRDGRPRLKSFATAIDRSRAESTLVVRFYLQRAIASGKWRAAAYFLEARHPEEWKLRWRYDRYGRPIYVPPSRPRPSVRRGNPERRPPRLTAEVKGRLCEAYRLGAFPAEAAAYAGISRSTLYHWLAMAEDPTAHPALEELAADVRQAEAAAALQAVFAIRRAADAGHRRAAAWLLERREPERWGPVDRFGRRPTHPRPDA